MDDLIARVPAACRGITYKDGGLNKSDIQKILKHIGLPYANGNREKLLLSLCQKTEKMQFLLSGKPAHKYICHPIAFVQYIDICWFHASAVALFLSDDSRNYMWNTLFIFEKNTRKPIALRPHDYPVHIALVLEMIRRSLELSYDSIYLYKGAKLHKDSVNITKCSKGIFDLICYLDNDWCGGEIDLDKRRKNTFEGGYTIRLMRDLSRYLPFNIVFPDEDEEVDAFVGSSEGHAVAYYLCEGTWRMFDNERSDTVIDIDLHGKVKNLRNVFDRTDLGPFEDTIAIKFDRSSVEPEYHEANTCDPVYRMYRFIESFTNIDTLWLLDDVIFKYPWQLNDIFGSASCDHTPMMKRLINDRYNMLYAEMQRQAYVKRAERTNSILREKLDELETKSSELEID
jgi:hypothetical protein